MECVSEMKEQSHTSNKWKENLSREKQKSESIINIIK